MNPPGRVGIALRVVLPLVGGYALCWGAIAFTVPGLFALGVPFHDAENIAAIGSFVLYLAAWLWAFAASSLWRASALLFGSGALMAGLGEMLQRQLVS